MIFVVLPAFNEEKKIGRVIRGLFEHGFENIIVVDDGSTDNTSIIAKVAGATVVSHIFNRGQGAALQTGNEFALACGAQTIIHFDADGQFNPSDIHTGLLRLQTEQVDIIFGSRFLDKRSKIPFFKRFFVLPVSRLINNFFTGLQLTDVHNGFRIMRSNVAENLIITQDGMAHNSEIPRLIKDKHFSYAEHPVEVVYFETGQGVGGGIKILWDLIMAKFSK
jgi:glycosyltransferase involved in cell wall biosynthesis